MVYVQRPGQPTVGAGREDGLRRRGRCSDGYLEALSMYVVPGTGYEGLCRLGK